MSIRIDCVLVSLQIGLICIAIQIVEVEVLDDLIALLFMLELLERLLG